MEAITSSSVLAWAVKAFLGIGVAVLLPALFVMAVLWAIGLIVRGGGSRKHSFP